MNDEGDIDGVAIIHAWLTRLALNWVRHMLKKTVAMHKLQIIGSTADLRKRLTAQLGDLGNHVTGQGDVLGVDCGMGSALRLRPISRARLKKAIKRRKRLRWWRNLGGDAKAVVRGGLIPSVSYGGESVGITAATMRDARRAMAALSRIRAGGSSTTSRLALGGPNYDESDPMVTLANPPLAAVAAKLWDDPRSRSEHVYAWRSAKERLENLPPGRRWTAIRGPVDGALAHLLDVGASWGRPFHVTLLDHEVPLLSTPPKQVTRIVMKHNRRFLDRLLIARLGERLGWQGDKVDAEYANGIDWDLIRDLLRGKCGDLTSAEKRALEVLCCGALWPEKRRWLAGGGLPTGSCMRCCRELADERHSLHECEALELDIMWAKIAGRFKEECHGIDNPALAPLTLAGLPPRRETFGPPEVEFQEGEVRIGSHGTFYGDASGIGCKGEPPGIVTWSLVQLSRDVEGSNVDMDDGAEDGDPLIEQMMRGRLGGWFPSVPRGELAALLQFCKCVMIPSTYVGDCRYVTDGVARGIPAQFSSSACAHADLWRELRWRLDDHGGGINVVKTKAHRSKQCAIDDSDDGILHWVGNGAADAAAKTLARSAWGAGAPQRDLQHELRVTHCRLLVKTAASAHWAMRALDDVVVAGKRGHVRQKRRRDDVCGEHCLVPRPNGKGRWCSKCRLITTTPSSWKTLAAKQCKGEVSDMAHTSHALKWSGQVLYCGICGWYTSRVPRSLRRPCKGRPASAAARNVLQRLRQGMPPTTAKYHVALTEDCERPRAGDAASGSHAVEEQAPQEQDDGGGDRDVHQREEEVAVDGGGGHMRDAVMVPGVGRWIERCDEDNAQSDPGENGEAHESRRRSGSATHLTNFLEARGQDDSHVNRASAVESASLYTVTAAPRRRLRGKQPPGGRPPGSIRYWCDPPLSAPWSRRVTAGVTWAQAECRICGTRCRLRCRACGGAICLACARGARSCNSRIEVASQ